MSPELEKQIKRLSIEERIRLVGEILDGIAREDKSFELSKAQRKELDRRLKSHSGGRSWKDIKAELLQP